MALADPHKTLTARWLFPVARPPLERGTITIAGARIVEVEPRGTRTADLDVGNAAILPGLVNAHTHLDLSGLRGLLPPSTDFTSWLRAVIAHRRSLTADQVEASIRAGLAECIRTGTTLLGDISAMGLSHPILAAASVRSVVYYELLGLSKERVRQAWAAAQAWLAAHPASAVCRPGLSPHAPYSVRRSLVRAAAQRAQRDHLPLAIHLAETTAELELLAHHTGPFRAFLEDLGVWDASGLAASAADVLRLTAGVGNVVFAHGNYLEPDPRATLVYCPRTHRAFGHTPHPFREFLARGARVALGTDSLASNPDLDLLAEARYVQLLYPEFPGDALLRMATLAGAEALGWADQTGSLEPGKSADLIVVPLPNTDPKDPHRLVWESSAQVSRVMARGQWIADLNPHEDGNQLVWQTGPAVAPAFPRG